MTRRSGAALPLALAILLAIVPATAIAKSPVNRISAISPDAAERGATVTVSGNGFGAKNVRITVGGVPAEVVSATGARATFRVPATAPIGPTTVVLRNPGGQGGSIGFEVLGPSPATFDGEVTTSVVAGAAVSATIGPEGGSITAGPVTLTIPPAALPVPTLITVTPLAGIGGSPLSSIVGGARLEPSGLHFVTPGSLTIPVPAGTPAGSIVGFAFAGEGSDFHLVPAVVAGGIATLPVSHFSGGGIAAPTQAELSAVLEYQPTPGQATAEQAIAATLLDPALDDAARDAAIAQALRDWYAHSVSQGLQIAAGSDQIELFELAIGEWLAWLGFVQANGVGDLLTNEVTGAELQALLAAKAHATLRLDACTGVGDIVAPFKAVLRLAATLNLWDAPIESDGSGLPAAHELDTSCMRVEIDAVTHPAAFAVNLANSIEVEASVFFANGPRRTSVPLTFRLADVTDGAPVAIDADSVLDGQWQAAVEPSQVGQRSYDLRAELTAAQSDDTLLALSALHHFAVPVRPRIAIQADGPGDAFFVDAPQPVGPNASVSLRIRLAGDGMAGRAVGLALGGSNAGALGSLAALTNAQGEAFVEYTGPSVCATDIVTASIAEAAGSSSDAVSISTVLPVTGVSVTPTSATLSPGGTRQFAASVTGDCSGAVVWTATGGTISPTGLYTAGGSTGTFAVTATSVADPTISATATVTIASAGTVTLIETAGSRLRYVRARAEACAGQDGVGCVLVSAGDQKSTTGLLPFNEALDFAISQGGTAGFYEGNSAAAIANALQNSEISQASAPLEVTAFGSVVGTSVVEFGVNPSAGASHSAISDLFLTFRVDGGPLPYHASGVLTRSGNANVMFSLYRIDPGVGSTEIVRLEDGALDASGTLAPGRYELGISASSSGNADSGVDVGGTADYTVTFSVGP